MKRFITAFSATGVLYLKAKADTCQTNVFQTLANKHNVTTNSVSLVSGTRGRGVFVTQEIPEGDTIFAVPLRLCVKEDEINGDVNFWGALQLMQRLNKDKFWIDYKMLLPFPAGVPFELPEELLSAIADTVVSSAIRNLKREVHSELHKILKEKTSAVQEKFDWVYALVLSRSFGLNYSGDVNKPDIGHAFIPFIDMVNHSTMDWNAEVVLEEGRICMKSTRNLKEREEVLIQYTPGPNAAFFLKYGFIELDNPEDVLILDQDIEVDVNLFTEFLIQNHSFFKEEASLRMLKMVQNDESGHDIELQRLRRVLERLDFSESAEMDLPMFVQRYQSWYINRVSIIQKILKRYVIWLKEDAEKESNVIIK